MEILISTMNKNKQQKNKKKNELERHAQDENGNLYETEQNTSIQDTEPPVNALEERNEPPELCTANGSTIDSSTVDSSMVSGIISDP